MKNQSKNIIWKTCLLIGICLLAVGILVLVFWQWNIDVSVRKSESYVHTLGELIPHPQSAVLEQRKDNTMPTLAVDGTDFVGIVEMPGYGSALPVGAGWGRITRYPCRFGGSVYDGTMQIGTTTQKGQYDFYREISVGDTVLFTDVEGNRYTYVITGLRYVQHADQTALNSKESALTLFVKNVYDFEYLIISCDAIS